MQQQDFEQLRQDLSEALRELADAELKEASAAVAHAAASRECEALRAELSEKDKLLGESEKLVGEQEMLLGKKDSECDVIRVKLAEQGKIVSEKERLLSEKEKECNAIQLELEEKNQILSKTDARLKEAGGEGSAEWRATNAERHVAVLSGRLHHAQVGAAEVLRLANSALHESRVFEGLKQEGLLEVEGLRAEMDALRQVYEDSILFLLVRAWKCVSICGSIVCLPLVILLPVLGPDAILIFCVNCDPFATAFDVSIAYSVDALDLSNVDCLPTLRICR